MAGDSAKIDPKRYQIISLLYIIFVCFSTLNIKVSVIDSQKFVIETFQKEQDEVLKKVKISNLIISNNIDKLNAIDTAKSYLAMSIRIDTSLNIINSVLNHINSEIKLKNINFAAELSKRSFIESKLKDPIGLKIIEEDLFKLNTTMKSAKYVLRSNLEKIIPIEKEIRKSNGRLEDWEGFLFFHKPMGMSYMQLERIKLLIIQTKLLYQEAALSAIGYEATYFSPYDPKLYILKTSVKEYKEEEILKPGQKPINIEYDVADDLFKKLIVSLHTENLFVGLNNTLLDDNGFKVGTDFDIDISPKSYTIKNNVYNKIIFNKTGEYNISFYDLRNQRKLLFERKISVNPIPDPIVRVKGDNLNSYKISAKDLFNSVRLEAILKINNLSYFPGRINSFNVIKIHDGIDESILNYGELFQSTSQKLLSSVKKNDIIIFDNVNISLLDGSSRVSPPIIYKITD